MEISAWPSCQNDVDVIEQTLQELNWLASSKEHKKNKLWNCETNHKLALAARLPEGPPSSCSSSRGWCALRCPPHHTRAPQFVKIENWKTNLHTTMAPCNGTQQWHHVHSTKVGRHPPRPLLPFWLPLHLRQKPRVVSWQCLWHFLPICKAYSRPPQDGRGLLPSKSARCSPPIQVDIDQTEAVCRIEFNCL